MCIRKSPRRASRMALRDVRMFCPWCTPGRYRNRYHRGRRSVKWIRVGRTTTRIQRFLRDEAQAELGLLRGAPRRRDARPEIGEFDGVEEGHDVDYFFVLHSHVPRVGVLVRF